MAKSRFGNTAIYKRIAGFKKLYHIAKVKPSYFIVMTFSGIIVGLLDGISVGLLVPLASGIINSDFSFLKNTPIFKNIINRFPEIYANTPAKLLFTILIGTIFIVVVMKNILRYFFNMYGEYKRGKYIFRLERAIFERYLNFGKLYFDRTNIGKSSRIISFSNAFAELLRVLAQAMEACFILAFYMILMIMISWRLAIFAVLIFPILKYSVQWIVKKIEATAKAHSEVGIELARQIFNVLSGLQLVKAYGNEKNVAKKYNDINDLLRRLRFSWSKKTNFISPVQEIIMLIALLLLVSLAAFIFMKGKMGAVPGFLVFFYLIRRGMPIFGSLSQLKAEAAAAEVRIKFVLDVFDDKDKFIIPEGPKVFDGLKREIEFKHLNFSYNKEVPVLKGISFFLQKGKMIAIVGPTGAGKTTIINLLMRFYDCPQATIFLDGNDIREFSLRSLRQHIAIVTQDALLFNDSIQYNVTFGSEEKVSEGRLLDVAKKARLYDFIKKLPNGFNTEVGDRGIKLSGGEKQRVSIARALFKEADILILDEATSSLDTHTERLIQGAVEEAVKGRTTIVIAHRLSTIKNADKIMVVEDGELVEEGALEELLAKKGKFYQYWEEQKFY